MLNFRAFLSLFQGFWAVHPLNLHASQILRVALLVLCNYLRAFELWLIIFAIPDYLCFVSHGRFPVGALGAIWDWDFLLQAQVSMFSCPIAQMISWDSLRNLSTRQSPRNYIDFDACCYFCGWKNPLDFRTKVI